MRFLKASSCQPRVERNGCGVDNAARNLRAFGRGEIVGCCMKQRAGQVNRWAR
ncbi:MAG: hypothetical protein IMY76_06090 [Chloroflexi bacterium]|nr:hypothetical protein [Chloroflexota bacterium]